MWHIGVWQGHFLAHREPAAMERVRELAEASSEGRQTHSGGLQPVIRLPPRGLSSKQQCCETGCNYAARRAGPGCSVLPTALCALQGQSRAGTGPSQTWWLLPFSFTAGEKGPCSGRGGRRGCSKLKRALGGWGRRGAEHRGLQPPAAPAGRASPHSGRTPGSGSHILTPGSVPDLSALPSCTRVAMALREG